MYAFIAIFTEYVTGNESDPYSFKADIFSLGSIMYNLLTGRYLFDEEDHNLLLKQNLKCDLTPIKKYIEAVSPQAADLMMSLL